MIPGQFSHHLVERLKGWLLVRARPATVALFIAALVYASSVLLVHWADHCDDHGQACAVCVAAANAWATLPTTSDQAPDVSFWKLPAFHIMPVWASDPDGCYAPRGPPRAPVLGRLV